jgi:hypothetical protein
MDPVTLLCKLRTTAPGDFLLSSRTGKKLEAIWSAI